MTTVVHRLQNQAGTELHTLMFFCPGCQSHHAISDAPGGWSFNGDYMRPTFSPSVLVNADLSCPSLPRCHSFVGDGQIQFLGDCTHALAGQTVALEAF